MIELENPQIEPVEEAGTYAKYEAGPLQAGYGVTLGNALRRVLLSSLDGRRGHVASRSATSTRSSRRSPASRKTSPRSS